MKRDVAEYEEATWGAVSFLWDVVVRAAATQWLFGTSDSHASSQGVSAISALSLLSYTIKPPSMIDSVRSWLVLPERSWSHGCGSSSVRIFLFHCRVPCHSPLSHGMPKIQETLSLGATYDGGRFKQFKVPASESQAMIPVSRRSEREADASLVAHASLALLTGLLRGLPFICCMICSQVSRVDT